MHQREDRQAFHAGLPGWFIRFQDTVGLSLLVVALMGINGVVYASGVVKNIEDPGTWGPFGTGLLILFFMAGMVMPGIALRAGSGIFWGPFLRRLICALVAVMFFGLEVWTSVAERSFMSFKSPADVWALSVLRVPSLPFSPTVLALSLAISTAVVCWGIISAPPEMESADEATRREELKTIKARAKAERMKLYADALGGSARAAVRAATRAEGDDEGGAMAAQSSDDTTDNDESEAGTSTRRKSARSGAPAGLMSAPQFRALLARSGVFITPEKARGIVQTETQHQQIGTAYYASKRALKARAMRMISEAQSSPALVG